jgi:hypothetical protein
MLFVTALFLIILFSSVTKEDKSESVMGNTTETFPSTWRAVCYIYLLKISRMYFLLRKFAKNAINCFVTYQRLTPEMLRNCLVTSRQRDLSVLESCPMPHDSVVPSFGSCTALKDWRTQRGKGTKLVDTILSEFCDWYSVRSANASKRK